MVEDAIEDQSALRGDCSSATRAARAGRCPQQKGPNLEKYFEGVIAVVGG